jgi:hypothetical protein
MAHAQYKDSTKTTTSSDTVKTQKQPKSKYKYISPNKVALQSTFLPGLGQITNHRAWEVPIIYGGFAVLGYLIVDNNKQYDIYRDAYRQRLKNDTNNLDKFDIRSPIAGPKYSSDGLLELREYYRRNRDLSIIVSVIVYAANIVDAYVFAQLKDFDVSNDLSMQLHPINISMMPGFQPAITTGITIKLK